MPDGTIKELMKHQNNCMRKIKFIYLSAVMALCSTAQAQQEDLLKGVVDSAGPRQYATAAFKSSRVINGHSMEMLGKGVLDVRILHRFGPVNNGLKEFFGLDQASMRLGFDYGIGTNLTAGIGRTSVNKEFDAFLKWRPIRQKLLGAQQYSARRRTKVTRKVQSRTAKSTSRSG